MFLVIPVNNCSNRIRKTSMEYGVCGFSKIIASWTDWKETKFVNDFFKKLHYSYEKIKEMGHILTWLILSKSIKWSLNPWISWFKLCNSLSWFSKVPEAFIPISTRRFALCVTHSPTWLAIWANCTLSRSLFCWVAVSFESFWSLSGMSWRISPHFRSKSCKK